MKIAVVGLGSTGLGVSASLAAAGHDVWGFEQNGSAAAHGSSRGDTRIFRLTPGEGAIYVDLAEDALRRWRLLETQVKASLLERRFGYMAGPPESAFVQSCVRLCREHARDYALIDAAGASRETEGWVRLPRDWVICRQAECGILAVPAALGALARKAASSGARLAFETPVAGPVSSPRLRIADAWHDFDRVILAAGPWMPQVAREMAPDLAVTRKALAWFAPIESARPRVTMPVLCLDDQRGTYGMQTPGGLFKIGLHAFGGLRAEPDAVEPVRSEDIEPIAAAVREYLPNHAAAPKKTDVCLYTMARDENFVIRELAADGRVLAMSCCSGHGFKYAPALGEIALDWAEGRDSAFLRGFGASPERAPSLVALTETIRAGR